MPTGYAQENEWFDLLVHQLPLEYTSPDGGAVRIDDHPIAPMQEHILAQKELERIVEAHILRLTPRQREAVRCRFGIGAEQESFTALAVRNETSVSWVSRQYREGIENLAGSLPYSLRTYL